MLTRRGLENMMRWVNYTRRTSQSQTGTSPDGIGCITGQTVNSIGKGGGQYRRYKHCKWAVKDTVFNLILRMQAIVLILISTYLSGMMKSTPVMIDKEQRPSKYTAQLFYCGVPKKSNYCRYLKTVMKDQRRGRWLH